MTVKEFIDFLSKYPENTELLFTYSCNWTLTPSTDTYTRKQYNKMLKEEIGYKPFDKEWENRKKSIIIDLNNY